MGKGIGAGWSLLAKGVGSAARAGSGVGRGPRVEGRAGRAGEISARLDEGDVFDDDYDDFDDAEYDSDFADAGTAGDDAEPAARRVARQGADRGRPAGHSHRRDGVALGLLAFALVVGASVWFGAAGPVGAFVDALVRAVIGSLAVVTPVALVALAIMLMRRPPAPESRARYIGGGLLVVLPALGLIHLIAGAPVDLPGRSHAAGFLGFAMGLSLIHI